MKKRGVSAVVATVLIILITIAAVALVSQTVLPMIKDNLDFSALEGRVEVVTSGGYTFYDAVEKKASVQIKRGMNDVEMDNVDIIFSIGGNTFGNLVVAPSPGNTRTYVFDLSDYGAPDSVSVAPVFTIGKTQKEGDATSDVEVNEGEVGVGGFVYDVDVSYGARSCSDWFDMGYETDGTYEIDPDGKNVGADPFETYCDMTGGGGIGSWTIDAESGDTSDWSGSVAIDSVDTHSGSYSFTTSGASTITSTDMFPVDTTKNYHLEGWFKSGGTTNSKLYFGFIPYDQDKKFISHVSVAFRTNTETTLYEDIAAADKIIKIVDGTGWGPWRYNAIAFDIDDSGNYNDLPNYKLSDYDIIRVENMGAYWEVEFNAKVGETYPAGTKIREHYAGGTYLYSAASSATIPNVWTEYDADLSEELTEGTSSAKWRKGTKYTKIVMLANYRQGAEAKLYYDDIKLVAS